MLHDSRWHILPGNFVLYTHILPGNFVPGKHIFPGNIGSIDTLLRPMAVYPASRETRTLFVSRPPLPAATGTDSLKEKLRKKWRKPHAGPLPGTPPVKPDPPPSPPGESGAQSTIWPPPDLQEKLAANKLSPQNVSPAPVSSETSRRTLERATIDNGLGARNSGRLSYFRWLKTDFGPLGACSLRRFRAGRPGIVGAARTPDLL